MQMFLMRWIGATFLVSTMSLGAETNIFLSIVALAGLSGPQVLFQIAFPFSEKINFLK